MTAPDRLAERHQAAFGKPPALTARAPGRVNLLGEHVDYNDGLAIPCGIDRFARVSGSPRSGTAVELVAQDIGKASTFDLEQIGPDSAGSMPRWSRYPAGVAWSLRQAGFTPPGLQAVFTSEVPIGAGLSSSAAMEVAFAALWRGLLEAPIDDLELARLCQRAENEFVGVKSGLMDQWTSTHARGGHVLLLDFQAHTTSWIGWPEAVRIVVAHTGVRRSLGASAYNQRVEECRQAVELLGPHVGGLSSLRDLSAQQLEAHAHRLPAHLRKRARHVVGEIERVRVAAQALQAGDIRTFGQKMFEGHDSLRELYEVSGPELDLMVELAGDLPGCLGARLTGAGFGGCTVNLVEKERAKEFADLLERNYRRQAGRRAKIWICEPGDGASLA